MTTFLILRCVALAMTAVGIIGAIALLVHEHARRLAQRNS